MEGGGIEEPDGVDQEVVEGAFFESVEHVRREEEELITFSTHIPISHTNIMDN